MKKLLIVISLSLAATATIFPQGLVNFVNSPGTLVSTLSPGGLTTSPISGPPGSYYFALLLYPVGSTDGPLTFTGIYATNTGVAGMLNGGSGISVPGWAPGTERNYEIFGWSANLGHDWQPSWLEGIFGVNGVYFGGSAIGTGIAGGFDGTASIPPLDMFGGVKGLQSGLVLVLPGVPVPEPSTAALAALLVSTLIVHRRGKKREIPLRHP